MPEPQQPKDAADVAAEKILAVFMNNLIFTDGTVSGTGDAIAAIIRQALAPLVERIEALHNILEIPKEERFFKYCSGEGVEELSTGKMVFIDIGKRIQELKRANESLARQVEEAKGAILDVEWYGDNDSCIFKCGGKFGAGHTDTCIVETIKKGGDDGS